MLPVKIRGICVVVLALCASALPHWCARQPGEVPWFRQEVLGWLPITAPTQAPVRESLFDFESIIRRAADVHGIDPALLAAVIQVESGFNPYARSHRGAMGLMQLMPATARAVGVHAPFDPWQNVLGGAKYLRQLLDQFHGSVPLALAAYNAGPGAVRRFGRRIPPYRETRRYVPRVVQYYRQYARMIRG